MPKESNPAIDKPVVTNKRKKAKRSVPNGQIHVRANSNNTLICVTDSKGNVIASSSAGACGFKGSKKATAYAAQVASEKVLSLAKTSFGLQQVEVFINGIGLGRESAVRTASSLGLDVLSISDITGIPHGGVRPKKSRRV